MTPAESLNWALDRIEASTGRTGAFQPPRTPFVPLPEQNGIDRPGWIETGYAERVWPTLHFEPHRCGSGHETVLHWTERCPACKWRNIALQLEEQVFWMEDAVDNAMLDRSATQDELNEAYRRRLM